MSYCYGSRQLYRHDCTRAFFDRVIDEATPPDRPVRVFEEEVSLSVQYLVMPLKTEVIGCCTFGPGFAGIAKPSQLSYSHGPTLMTHAYW